MFQKIAVLLFGLGSFMLLARIFIPQDLGVWGLFLIISGIIETSRNALIRNGFILFINSEDESKKKQINFAALLTNISFTAFIIVILAALGFFFQEILNAPGLSLVLKYYCLTLLILIPFSMIEIKSTAVMDFRTIFWMYFLRNGLFCLYVIISYLVDYDITLPVLSLAFAVCALIGTIIGYLLIERMDFFSGKWEKSMFMKFIHYGKFIWGNNICSLVFRNTDSFLTASYISAAASAFYSSCTRITNFADMPSQVLGDIMFPKAAQIMKSKNLDHIKVLYEKTVAATLTFTIPVVIFVLLFPKTILLVIAGEQYVSASGILQVIILYGMFLPFIRQFGNIMDVTGRPKINFTVLLIFAIINIAMNILSIRIWGLPGAAYGTLFSYFLLFLTTYFVLFKTINVSFFNVVKYIFTLYADYFNLLKSGLFKLKTKYAK